MGVITSFITSRGPLADNFTIFYHFKVCRCVFNFFPSLVTQYDLKRQCCFYQFFTPVPVGGLWMLIVVSLIIKKNLN